MDLVPRPEFFRWAAGVGVGLHPDYAASGFLTLLPPGDHHRFWVNPPDPAVWPDFADAILDGLDEWANLTVWPRTGSWPAAGGGHPGERVHAAIVRGAGVPGGWDGAARFRAAEADVVLALLFANLGFGWCVDDDLYLVPDHGRQLVQTDHHGVVRVECRSDARVRELVSVMAAAGYDLPTEVPDWTFKRPAWMDGDAEEAGP